MIEDVYLDRPVLAIYPNSFGFGYAVFKDDNTPLYCGVAVKNYRKKNNYLDRIQKMINAYKPTTLILPTANGKFNRKRERIQALLSEIHEYATSNNLKVQIYSREQIRIVFEPHGAYSKQEIAEKICETFTEFKDRCPKKKMFYMPERYFQGMFDAISLVNTHFYMN